MPLYVAPVVGADLPSRSIEMADDRLSEKFDALSDKAKESANKLKASAGARRIN